VLIVSIASPAYLEAGDCGASACHLEGRAPKSDRRSNLAAAKVDYACMVAMQMECRSTVFSGVSWSVASSPHFP
jgi:hypothetical protein